MKQWAILLAALCVFSPAHGWEAESLVHQSLRTLLQGAGLPPICIPLGKEPPRVAPPICPKGTTPYGLKDPPEMCASCPDGYGLNSDATKCLFRRCPKPYINPVNTGNATNGTIGGLTCCYCDKAETPIFLWPGRPSGTPGCYARCPNKIAVDNAPPRCCSRTCPPGFPIAVPSRPGFCRNNPPFGTRPTLRSRDCTRRTPVSPACIKPVNGEPTLQDPICPPGTLMNVEKGSVVCYACPTGTYPYLSPSGEVLCSGTKAGCPLTTYAMCGPYCWDKATPLVPMAAFLGQATADQCSAFLQLFAKCIDMCPTAVTTG